MGKLSDGQYPPVAGIPPQSLAIGSSADTAWADIGTNNGRLKFTLYVGAITSTGTVDCALYQATSSAGAGAKTVSGKSLAQITVSNGIAVIEVGAADLDINNGFHFVRAKVIDGTAAALVAVVVEGLPSATPPGVVSPVVQVV